MYDEDNHCQSTCVILTNLVSDLKLAVVLFYSYIHVFPPMKTFLKKMTSHCNGVGFNYIDTNNNNRAEKSGKSWRYILIKSCISCIQKLRYFPALGPRHAVRQTGFIILPVYVWASFMFSFLQPMHVL